MKQTETQPKQIEFRFFSVQTENISCLFRGHPSSVPNSLFKGLRKRVTQGNLAETCFRRCGEPILRISPQIRSQNRTDLTVILGTFAKPIKK